MTREEKTREINKIMGEQCKVKYNEYYGAYILPLRLTGLHYLNLCFYDYEGLTARKIAEWFWCSLRIESQHLITSNTETNVSYGDTNLYRRLKKFLKRYGIESSIGSKMFIISFPKETYRLPLECVDNMGFTKTLKLIADVFNIDKIKEIL